MQSLPAGQEEGHRQQYAQLPHHGDQHGQKAVAQGLKHGAADDTEAGEGEADGDDPQSGHADGQQVGGGAVLRHEQVDEHVGEELEDQQPHGHDAHRVAHAELDGGGDAVGPPGTVVIGHDGHHAVVQAEHGHEDEGLQLEIDTEHSGGRGSEGQQDLVHAKGHDRADRAHNDGGDAYAVNALDDAAVRAEALELEVNVGIQLPVEEDGQAGGHDLPDHGGDGGARYL